MQKCFWKVVHHANVDGWGWKPLGFEGPWALEQLRDDAAVTSKHAEICFQEYVYMLLVGCLYYSAKVYIYISYLNLRALRFPTVRPNDQIWINRAKGFASVVTRKLTRLRL